MAFLTDYPAGDWPRCYVDPLLHERSQGKPEAVDHAEVVAHLKRMFFSVKFSSKVKSTVVPDIDSSICHSYGENLKNDFLSRQALKEIQSCVYGILGRPADKEEDDADTDVGKDNAHPDLHRERVHESENSRADLSSSIIVNLTAIIIKLL